MANSIPKGYHSITPFFIFKDTRKAIEFYKKAFGASERSIMAGPDGNGVMHAEMMFGNSIIMMSDENPDCPNKSAKTYGGSPIGLYLYVQDVDAAFGKAVEAGCTLQMSVEEMFWGDRMGTVIDPFGYTWTLATHTEDLSPEEIERRAKEFYQNAGKK